MNWYLEFFTMEYAQHFLDNKNQIEHQCKLVSEAIKERPVQTIFEMCCGLGQLSLELAKKGYTVHAADIIPAYIEEALKRKEAAEVMNCHYYCEDVKSFTSSESFDVVLNMFSSFGYEDTPEENNEILRKAFQLLKSNGMLFMELYDSEFILSNFKTTFSHAFDDVLYERHCTLSPDQTYMFQHWKVFKKGILTNEFRSKLWLVSKEEIRHALKQVGFNEVIVESKNQRLTINAKI